MESISGFLLIIFTATMSGEGASTITVPTHYPTQNACEFAAKKVTFSGEAFGLRLDSRGSCIPAGTTSIAPLAVPPSTSSQNGNKVSQ